MSCSCVDCPTCPLIKLEINSGNGFMIAEFNGYGVVAAILIIVFSITAPFVGILYNFSKTCRKKGMNGYLLSIDTMEFLKVRRNIYRIYPFKYFQPQLLSE